MTRIHGTNDIAPTLVAGLGHSSASAHDSRVNPHDSPVNPSPSSLMTSSGKSRFPLLLQREWLYCRVCCALTTTIPHSTLSLFLYSITTLNPLFIVEGRIAGAPTCFIYNVKTRREREPIQMLFPSLVQYRP